MKKITSIVLLLLLSSGNLIGQKDAMSNFDALWNVFDQNYASFEEKGIDWYAEREKYRPLITENSTDLELYEVFKKMLTPLNDGHVTLRAKNLDSAFSANRPSRIISAIRQIPRSERRPAFNDMISNTLSSEGFNDLKMIGPLYKSEHLFKYANNGKIGYLSFLRSFYSVSRAAGKPLNKLLDAVFGSFSGLDGLILDIRFNMGGDDAFSQALAGRFIDSRTIGFYKQTLKNKSYRELKPKYIEPTGSTSFKGKVVLLTNDRSVSAADVLALILSKFPQVTIIGERSNGSYSDLYPKRLPNGWKVTLSNQRYFDIDMNNFEGKGTPVDIKILNSLDDIQGKNDSVLRKAFEVLNE